MVDAEIRMGIAQASCGLGLEERTGVCIEQKPYLGKFPQAATLLHSLDLRPIVCWVVKSPELYYDSSHYCTL